jgi:hypothetical protein
LALLFLCPIGACAGTSYVLTNKSLLPRDSAVSVAQYYVQDRKVHAAGVDGRRAYLFEDAKVYVIDHGAKSIQVVTSALTTQAADKLDERVASIEESAAKLPPDRRAVLQKMAADMKALNDSRRQPVPRDFHVTDRSDTVDGHACRIWEAFEWDRKRFEFCVAPKSGIPGSAEILGGMQALSAYQQGSIFALGVKLGNTGWWSGIAGLEGVPILIREFKDGAPASETALTAIRDGVAGASMFDLPKGYPLTEVSFIP